MNLSMETSLILQVRHCDPVKRGHALGENFSGLHPKNKSRQSTLQHYPRVPQNSPC